MSAPRNVVLGIALLGFASAAPAAAAPPESGISRAAGGVGIFSALEKAPVSVVGVVRSPTALDGESYRAWLDVEVVLTGSVERGTRIPFVWEELSRSRPVRFDEGESLLVSLERLPGDSIWRQRLPDPETRVRTFSVAVGGDAFVREPSPGAVELVNHFLALPRDLRDGNPGVAHLVQLAAGATPPLARGAVERLAAVAALDRVLDPTTSERLVGALLRDDTPLSSAILDLVEVRRPESLRPALEARATADGLGPALAYAALARLDGSVRASLAQKLLERLDSPAHRRVGARYAAGDLETRLARLLRSDPDPEVRSAAVTRLVEIDGTAALDRVLFALDDEDSTVRATAMRELGSLGDAAVPTLRKTVESGSADAARTAVGALRAAGPTGIQALREIAETHPDTSVRLAADLALGRDIGHRH